MGTLPYPSGFNSSDSERAALRARTAALRESFSSAATSTHSPPLTARDVRPMHARPAVSLGATPAARTSGSASPDQTPSPSTSTPASRSPASSPRLYWNGLSFGVFPAGAAALEAQQSARSSPSAARPTPRAEQAAGQPDAPPDAQPSTAESSEEPLVVTRSPATGRPQLPRRMTSSLDSGRHSASGDSMELSGPAARVDTHHAHSRTCPIAVTSHFIPCATTVRRLANQVCCAASAATTKAQAADDAAACGRAAPNVRANAPRTSRDSVAAAASSASLGGPVSESSAATLSWLRQVVPYDASAMSGLVPGADDLRSCVPAAPLRSSHDASAPSRAVNAAGRPRQ